MKAGEVAGELPPQYQTLKQNNMEATIFHNIYLDNDDVLEVQFTGEFSLENDGIGGYECRGIRGYDKGEDYFVCEDIYYNESKYSESTNSLIQSYLTKNIKQLEDEMIQKLEYKIKDF